MLHIKKLLPPKDTSDTMCRHCLVYKETEDVQEEITLGIAELLKSARFGEIFMYEKENTELISYLKEQNDGYTTYTFKNLDDGRVQVILSHIEFNDGVIKSVLTPSVVCSNFKEASDFVFSKNKQQ